MADAGAVAQGGWSWSDVEDDSMSRRPADQPAHASVIEPATHDAFARFVAEWQHLVYATALRLLANPAEAEDVAQTVFLRAFQHFDAVGTSPAAAGWLRTVTRHACLNHLSRYRARWRFFSELRRDDDEGAAYEETLVATDTADGAAGPSAGAAGAVPLRGCDVSGDRRGAWRVDGEGEDRHASGTAGAAPRPWEDRWIPLNSSGGSIAN
jgi:RNA polymerase sigma factor (sigma-70 family)